MSWTAADDIAEEPKVKPPFGHMRGRGRARRAPGYFPGAFERDRAGDDMASKGGGKKSKAEEPAEDTKVRIAIVNDDKVRARARGCGASGPRCAAAAQPWSARSP